jgi:hypothetical protein
VKTSCQPLLTIQSLATLGSLAYNPSGSTSTPQANQHTLCTTGGQTVWLKCRKLRSRPEALMSSVCDLRATLRDIALEATCCWLNRNIPQYPDDAWVTCLSLLCGGKATQMAQYPSINRAKPFQRLHSRTQPFGFDQMSKCSSEFSPSTSSMRFALSPTP